MSDIPIHILMGWPEPNYENPETRGIGHLVGSVILGVAAFGAVVLRLWARIMIMRRPAADDYFILLALVLIAATSELHPKYFAC